MLKYIPLLLLIFITACTSVQVVENNDIDSIIKTEIKNINSNRKYLYTLRNKKVAKSGYFYIINNDGIITHHYNPLLIGRNFKGYWFVKHILDKKSGCLSYFFANSENYIFYQPLNKNETICLSIRREDFKGTLPSCETKQ